MRIGALLFLSVWMLMGSTWVLPSQSVAAAEEQALFIRGDVNLDGKISIADLLFISRHVFQRMRLPCLDAADLNDDEVVALPDALRMVEVLCYLDLSLSAPYPLPGEDPTPGGLDCVDNEMVPARENDDRIRVGNVTAAPGALVSVPVYITHSVPVEAFQIVLKTNPSFFTFETDSTLDFTGTVVEEIADERHDVSGWLIPMDDEQSVVLYSIFNALGNVTLPASNEERLLVKMVAKISPDVQVDAVMQVFPASGEDGQGTGSLQLKNELVSYDEAIYASIMPRYLQGGVISIQNGFIRCDVNLDNRIDIGDAIFTLTYLFNDGPAPDCDDAADANDDGELALSDPITMLDYLFNDTSLVPVPFPLCGTDPTPDDLDCAVNACGN